MVYMEVKLTNPFRFPTFDDFLIEKKTLDTLVLHDFDIKSGLTRFFEKYDMKDETHMFDNRIDLKELVDYSNRHLRAFVAAPKEPVPPNASTAASLTTPKAPEDETMKFAVSANFIERHVMRINDLKLMNFIKVLRKFKNLLNTNQKFFKAIQELNKTNKQKNKEQVAAIKSASTNIINTALETQIKKIINSKTSDDVATKTEIDGILVNIKEQIKDIMFRKDDNETIDEDLKTWSNAEMEIVESEYFKYSNTVYCFLANKFGYTAPVNCLFFKSVEGGIFTQLARDFEEYKEKEKVAAAEKEAAEKEAEEKEKEAKEKEAKEKKESEESEEKARLEKEKLIEQIMQSGVKEAEIVFKKIINATKTKPTSENVKKTIESVLYKLYKEGENIEDERPSFAKIMSDNTENDTKHKKNSNFL